MRQISGSIEETGWLSPEGEFYEKDSDRDVEEMHCDLAKEIIQNEGKRRGWGPPGDDDYCVDFLFEQGWARVVGTSENSLYLQYLGNSLKKLKSMLKKYSPGVSVKLGIVFGNSRFRGSLGEFLKWDGTSQKKVAMKKISELMKADFGGDMCNIDSLSNGDGPGTQRQVVEDYQPAHHGLDDDGTMEEGGEFVHTHPTKGPPRHDIRKLKIVDE